ncbi:hypothetical protein Taro_051546 [Colocasia esculenta]|uniref:Uncharacterized protein n=1 Tax=Colocasia esculenta TaxID=4460 RepID=A0A843XH39_COLES|nr:hypothetical protein [Colocasia esculenta]
MVGRTPDDIFNCTELVRLDLASNSFRGILNPRIGMLTKLRKLLLQQNYLFCSIPPEVGNLTKLQKLRLGTNKFSGKIPSEISKLPVLQGLNFPAKKFLRRCNPFSVLHLQQNRLTGSIPDAISKLRMLNELKLHNNQLNGSIPGGIKNLQNLMLVDISHNKLTGSLHGSLVASMKSLQIYLNLSNNMLEGSVPTTRQTTFVSGCRLLTKIENPLTNTYVNGLCPLTKPSTYRPSTKPWFAESESEGESGCS